MKRILTTLSKKWPEYLLEILVITIGILGAFTLNNWNERSNNMRRYADYRVALTEDIKRDTAELNSLLAFINESTIAQAALKARLTSSTATLDTIVQIARNDFAIYANTIDAFNTGTFDVLNSTGDIILFGREASTMLYKLSSRQAAALSGTQDTWDAYFLAVGNYASKYTFAVPFSPLSAGPIHEAIWSSIDPIQLAKDFHSISFAKNNHLRVSERYYSELLNDSEIVLEKLNQ